MNNKKTSTIFIIILIIILLGGLLILKKINKKEVEPENETAEIEEYTPEEEISEEQTKQTLVSLYFLSKDTNELVPEARLVRINEIVNAPYDTLINLLVAGPKNDKESALIPENSKLLKTYMEDDIITLDFSSEFLNYDKTNEKVKTNLIASIVNTLTQLTEVNGVKILIDGSPSDEFADVYTLESLG